MGGPLRTAWVQGSGWKWVGRRMSEIGCADGCRRCVRNGLNGNTWGEGAAGDERAWMCGCGANGREKDALWMGKDARDARTAADGVQGSGRKWVEGATGDERAWMRRQL
eukprot:s4645_g4.t1